MSSPVRYALLEAEEVPVDDAWLGPKERERLAKLRVPKRRHDFRLGRFVVKRVLGYACPNVPLESLQILPDEEGAPRACRGDEPLPCSISLSHRGEFGLAVSGPEGLALGCDLELVEERSALFLSDYFTDVEQRFFVDHAESARTLWANLFWSAKESALKAQRQGLRRDARELEVTLESAEVADGVWAPLQVRDLEKKRDYFGYWQRRGALILSVASDQALAVPRSA